MDALTFSPVEEIIAEIAAGASVISPNRLLTAAYITAFVGQVVGDSRSGALRIRAPPEVSAIDI